MDEAKVKTGLITVGIIAGLTCILYFPVLVWSPPWGDNGYYHVYDDHRNYHIFSNGEMSHFNAWSGSQSDYKYALKRNGNAWEGTEVFSSRRMYVNYLKITITNGEMLIEDKHELSDPYTFDSLLVKTSNPFTLWYIKWLEWNQD